MTTIALLGASGRLGSHVLRHLHLQGHSVRALVHANTGVPREAGIERIEGDVHDADSLARLLEGAEAVVATLGNATAPVADVCATAVRNLVPLMSERRIARIVSTTGSAARLDDEIGCEHPSLSARRAMLMRRMGAMVLDGESHMRQLAASDLAWSVVRAPIMRLGAEVDAVLSVAPGQVDATLTYDAVAKLLVDELFASRWIGAAPFAVAA